MGPQGHLGKAERHFCEFARELVRTSFAGLLNKAEVGLRSCPLGVESVGSGTGTAVARVARGSGYLL